MEILCLLQNYLCINHLHTAGYVRKKKLHNSFSALVAGRKRWGGIADYVFCTYCSGIGIPDQK